MSTEDAKLPGPEVMHRPCKAPTRSPALRQPLACSRDHCKVAIEPGKIGSRMDLDLCSGAPACPDQKRRWRPRVLAGEIPRFCQNCTRALPHLPRPATIICRNDSPSSQHCLSARSTPRPRTLAPQPPGPRRRIEPNTKRNEAPGNRCDLRPAPRRLFLRQSWRCQIVRSGS